MLVMGRAVGSAIELQDPTVKTGTASLVDRSWMTIVSRIKALSKNLLAKYFSDLCRQTLSPMAVVFQSSRDLKVSHGGRYY